LPFRDVLLEGSIRQIAVAGPEGLGGVWDLRDSDKDVSRAGRSYFATAQNDSSDQEVIWFWLSIYSLERTSMPMFAAKQWAKRAIKSQPVDGAPGNESAWHQGPGLGGRQSPPPTGSRIQGERKRIPQKFRKKNFS